MVALITRPEMCPGFNGVPSEPVVPISKLPHTTKPPRNGFTGDVLNVTRCHCTSNHTKPEPHQICGYYSQADYFNYHSGRTYQTRWNCTGECGSGFIPDCWDIHARDLKRVCDIDDEENKFCYWFRYATSTVAGVTIDIW